MNYGLYLSASGMMTNMYRQDVFANNLSNVQTTGFKPDMPDVTHRAPEAIEDKLGFSASDRLLDKLGGGVFAGPQRIDMSTAPLTETGNPLDAAIQTDGHFFAVRVQDQQTGEVNVQLTRDGRFTRNSQGQLVTPTGHQVLNPDDEPIAVPAGGPVKLDARGQLLQNGEPVAQLQIANVDDPQQLEKRGAGMFGFGGQDPRQIVENPQLRPGFVESSGVNPISTLMRLISATKSVGGNAELIKYHDNAMDAAVNTLGRVT